MQPRVVAERRVRVQLRARSYQGIEGRVVSAECCSDALEVGVSHRLHLRVHALHPLAKPPSLHTGGHPSVPRHSTHRPSSTLASSPPSPPSQLPSAPLNSPRLISKLPCLHPTASSPLPYKSPPLPLPSRPSLLHDLSPLLSSPLPTLIHSHPIHLPSLQVHPAPYPSPPLRYHPIPSPLHPNRFSLPPLHRPLLAPPHPTAPAQLATHCSRRRPSPTRHHRRAPTPSPPSWSKSPAGRRRTSRTRYPPSRPTRSEQRSPQAPLASRGSPALVRGA